MSLFHSFDGSQRLSFLHLHETTVKDKLNRCLFHLQIFPANSIQTVHCWCATNNSFERYKPLSGRQCHKWKNTNIHPLPNMAKKYPNKILFLFPSCQRIKIDILHSTAICCNLFSCQVSKETLHIPLKSCSNSTSACATLESKGSSQPTNCFLCPTLLPKPTKPNLGYFYSFLKP